MSRASPSGVRRSCARVTDSMTASRTTERRPARCGLSRLDTLRASAWSSSAPKLRGGVRLVGHDQHVDAAAAGVEHVPRPFADQVDVGHQCGTWHAHAQLAHALEIGTAVDVQVEHHHVDRSALTRPRERGPVVARHEPVAIARGLTKSRRSILVRQQRSNHTHGTACGERGNRNQHRGRDAAPRPWSRRHAAGDQGSGPGRSQGGGPSGTARAVAPARRHVAGPRGTRDTAPRTHRRRPP